MMVGMVDQDLGDADLYPHQMILGRKGQSFLKQTYLVGFCVDRPERREAINATLTHQRKGRIEQLKMDGWMALISFKILAAPR